MKIIYVTNSLIPSNTANSINVVKMTSALKKYFDFTILIGRSNKLINTDKFKFYSVKPDFKIFLYKNYKLKFLNNIIFFIYYINKILKYKPDILYLRNLKMCILLLFFFQKIFIIEMHNSLNNRFDHFLFRNLILFKKKIIVICISNSLKIYYANNFKFLKNNTNLFYLHDGSDDLLNKNLDFKQKTNHNNNFNIGYFGSLYSGRGIELIIDISLRLPLYTFHIFGGSKNEILQYKSYKNKNLIFHGFVPPYQAEKLMLDMDCLIAPFQNKVSVFGNKGDTSKWMSPLKIFNYMASKKPIVASRIIVLKEVLKDKYNCIFCDPQDVDEWVRAINLIRKDINFRNAIANNAYYDFKNKYSWNLRAKNIKDIILNYEKI